MKLKISTRIMLLFLGMIAFLTIALGYTFLAYAKKALGSAFDERAEVLLESLASAGEYPLLVGDDEALSHIGAGALRQSDVVLCVIRDVGGVELFRQGSSAEEGQTRRRKITAGKLPEGEGMEALLFHLNEGEREAIGEIEIVLSTATLKEDLESVTRSVLVIAISASIVGLGLIYLLVRTVLDHPLRRLLNGVAVISSGDLTHRMHVERLDEIGVFTDKFNQMTDVLRGTMSDLQESNVRLRETQERVELAVRGADLGTWDWNVKTSETTYNERWAEMLGYTLAEIEPQRSASERLIHPDDKRGAGKALNSHLEGETDSYEGEHRLKHKSGDWIWVLDKGRVIERDADGKPLRVCGTHLDITARKRAEEERRQLERQLHHAQKMESIGQMAGGVAHDFNNLLSVILGYPAMMLDDQGLDEEQRTNLQQILDAGHRAQALTQQLLMFSRKQIIRPKPLCWNEQIEFSMKMYRRLIGEDIEIKFYPGKDLSTVMADPNQLDQILANLLLNARDAILVRAQGSTGSSISIETSMAQVAKADDNIEKIESGSYVCITVRDTGVGMDEATRARIFEPFFTTKGEGKGTGLGLSTVYGVVRQNKGSIRVESEPGQSTTFIILWPLLTKTKGAFEQLRRPGVPLRGTENLLLVEDEAMLRDFTARALGRLGYRVVVADCGEQALKLLEGDGPRPDLLVTDVVMPGMNGKELAEEARKRIPGLAILYLSGYSEDIMAHEGILDEDVELIEKPCTINILTHKIRELLTQG